MCNRESRAGSFKLVTDNRLEEIGAAKMVDAEFLRHVVVEASRQQIVEIRQLFKGESNAVFDVELADGTHVIARQHFFGAHDLSRFHNEARIMRAARSAQVPVAAVLGVDEGITSYGRMVVSVQTKLVGRPLMEALPSMTPARIEQVMTELRLALHRLHRMPTDGLALSPAHSLADIVESTSVVRQAVGASLLPTTVMPVLDAAIDELSDARFEQTGAVHMDFSPCTCFYRRQTAHRDYRLGAGSHWRRSV